jgi:hypothetical protein
MRIVPQWSGNPTAGQGLFMVSSDGFLKANHFEWFILTTGRFQFFMTDRFGATLLNAVTSNVVTFVAGTPMDLMVSWDGTSGAGKFKISINGVELETITMGTARTADANAIGAITIGNSPNGPRSNFKLNELVVFDNAENHVYATRTDFYTVAAFDGENNTDPGQANVRLATGYVIAGVAKTGALVAPALSDTKIGVAGDGGTGTYDGSDRWTSPAAGDLRNGTQLNPPSRTQRSGSPVTAERAPTTAPIATPTRASRTSAPARPTSRTARATTASAPLRSRPPRT